MASPAGTPGGGLPSAPGSGSLLRHLALVGRRENLLPGLRPHLLPAAHRGGRRRRRPVGKGPVIFPNISRWRRKTFGDFTGALRPVAPQPAPSNTQFDPATTAANLAAQQAASQQPQPPRPGATQSSRRGKHRPRGATGRREGFPLPRPAFWPGLRRCAGGPGRRVRRPRP